MRGTKYKRWSIEDWDDLDLDSLLSELSGFLMDSGFYQQYFEGQTPDGRSDFSMEEMKAAIREALKATSVLDDEMFETLFGENADSSKLDALVERLLKKLVDEGYLLPQTDGTAEPGQQGVYNMPREPGETSAFSNPKLRFELSDRGSDFLGFQQLKSLFGALGRSSLGGHETSIVAPGVESYEAPRPYEFGDPFNLDVSSTLVSALQRTGGELDPEYEDLQIRQGEYLSSCATVFLLDCSHSMILYGEDRFTPAKQVIMALSQLIRTRYPGDTFKVAVFHDGAEEIPLRQVASLRVGPYHTNTAEGFRLARRLLQRERKEMRQIIMVTDGKPSCIFVDNNKSKRNRDTDERLLYKNPFGLDPLIIQTTLDEAEQCRRAGITINTFMLTNDYALVEFIRQVATITKGKAYITGLGDLGRYVFYDYMKAKH